MKNKYIKIEDAKNYPEWTIDFDNKTINLVHPKTKECIAQVLRNDIAFSNCNLAIEFAGFESDFAEWDRYGRFVKLLKR